MNAKRKYILIHINNGVQSSFTNVYYYNKNHELYKHDYTSYIVEHAYEIVLPIVDNNPNHDINIRIDGESYTIGDIEQGYYKAMDE